MPVEESAMNTYFHESHYDIHKIKGPAGATFWRARELTVKSDY
jgi:hypothetical protein